MELIRDNFDIIRAWIESQELKPYEAYHVMWLKRRKDGVTDKGAQAAKHWFIHNVAELDKIKKSDMSSVVYSSYDEQFQWVALLALIALIADAIIMERKNHVLRRLNLFKKRR